MLKVLLVDDDHTMISLLKTLLGIEGYQVETVLESSGDLRENILVINPDIFLVDIFMGEINGLDLIRWVRQQPELEHSKIIMASGIDKSSECTAAGADGFLLKPYMPEELIKILNSFGPGSND